MPGACTWCTRLDGAVDANKAGASRRNTAKNRSGGLITSLSDLLRACEMPALSFHVEYDTEFRYNVIRRKELLVVGRRSYLLR